MIGRSLGHYQILDKLGEGGMGAVYLAEDTTLDRRVALKVLPEELASDPERLARFEREAKAVAALNHPNIVTVHTIEEADGVRFLTMEVVEGKALDRLIPAGGLDLERFFRLAIPLAGAVAAAHDKGITHRDLKPANIMVTDQDARLKILDFGLAKLEQSEGDDPEATLAATDDLTHDGAVLGTFPYMSPEQAEARPLDHRTDIFSLGTILYEMATSRRPFTGDSSAGLVSSILKDTPPPLGQIREELPRHLERIVGHCLEKDPRRRFQTARDVFNELRTLEKELSSDVGARTGSTATPASVPTEVTFTLGRRKLAGAGLALLMLALIAIAYLQFRDRSQPTEPAGPEAIDSIVALPSRVFGSADDAFLTDAVPSTLSTHMAGLEGISTLLPPTSQQVESLAGDLEKLAHALKVGAFVLSDITAPDASKLVLNVQVVSAGSRALLWSQQYEGSRSAYLDLVGRAAAGISGYLRPSGQPVTTTASGPARTSEAELAYRRGRHYSNRYNHNHREEDFDQALTALESALELDPSHAPAAAEVGSLHVYKFEAGDFSSPNEELLASVELWARRALELDPQLSTGWSLLAYAEWRRPEGNFRRQLEWALKGAALGPDQAVDQLELGAALAGRLALEANLHAARLDPLYQYPKLNAAGIWLKLFAGFDEAKALLDEVAQIEDEMPFLSVVRLSVALAAGRLEEARSLLEQIQIMAEEGRLDPSAPETLAVALTVAEELERGETAEARAELERLFSWPDGALFWVIEPLLVLCATRQDAVATRLILERYEQLGASFGDLDYDLLAVAPYLEFVRGEDWFGDMRSRARSHFEEILVIAREARSRGEFPRYLEPTLDEILAELEMSPAAPDSQRHAPAFGRSQ